MALNKSIASDHKLAHNIVDWITANKFQPSRHSGCQTKHYLFSFIDITIETRKILIAELNIKPLDLFLDMMAVVEEEDVHVIMSMIMRAYGKRTPDLLLTPKEVIAVAEYAEEKNLVGYYWIQRFISDFAPDPKYFVSRATKRGGVDGVATIAPLPDTATYPYLTGESIDEAIDGHNNAVFVKFIYNLARNEILKDLKFSRTDAEIDADEKLIEYVVRARAVLDARLRLGSMTGHLDEKEILLFRQYGPRNPPYHSNNDDDPSEFFMYTCTANDYDEELAEETPFSGRCQRTGLLVKGPRYCIRIPKKIGGWEGWYCSVEKAIEAVLACQGEDMIWEIAMLEEVQYLLKKYGVYQS